ncbi:MAG: 2,3-bisphosphoglycerate-independent phosphoglycerate mutase [Clostridiales Family XIII bacterium]|jgi:2,3-bisphosphoglycerate-independent phosphoglycerate mutase|nr:2,3-bisphosphoglycerate-independent phosphoglycerate mutase [Clostridiales Family XIII bacterium]
MLMILDGCGCSESEYGNAIKQADTPNLDRLWAERPHARLDASGLAVGLPDGQMGNSEVGHLNIGAGRTVYQALTRITKSIEDGDFFDNPALTKAMGVAKEEGRSLHIMGLVGPGGVHSHQDHIVALVKMAQDSGVSNIYIHAWLDGRDTPPRSAAGFLAELEASLAELGAGRIVTISGRYYAMDRDNRWERIEKAYDAITVGDGLRAGSVREAIESAYERGENDEFVLPTNIADGAGGAGCDETSGGAACAGCDETSGGGAAVTIGRGDAVIFFNFRPDRARALTRALTEPDFDGFERKTKPENLFFVTMTEYDATLSHVHVAYPPEEIKNTLGEYLSGLGLRQLRIAETEKYAHVTFFFNGGVEEPNPNEDRILIPSPKVATYDLQPEMSAYTVAERVIAEIASGKYDLIVLNFANMDMVGHTGVMEAAIKAAAAVDECIGRIVQAIYEAGGQLLITADHGNSESMMTEDGSPITAHSTNPVPLILAVGGDDNATLRGGKLSDIAPTLLDLMGIPRPSEMTGQTLLRSE